MVPFVAEYFHGTEIEEFFRQIIPVSMDIWIFFFLLPFALAVIAQILLCFGRGKVWTRFLPLMLAGLILCAGWSLVSLKLLLIVAFLWLTSPVQSHLLGKLALTVEDHPEREMQVDDPELTAQAKEED